MSGIRLSESVLSVMETDVIELAADPSGHGLTAEQASDYRMLADHMVDKSLRFPADPDKRERMCSLLTDLSNTYDDQAERGHEAAFSRRASRSLTTVVEAIRRAPPMILDEHDMAFALEFEPFDGDRGHTPTRLRNEIVTARKDHDCFGCDGVIAKGERHRVLVERTQEEGFGSWRWCQVCLRQHGRSLLGVDDA